MLGAPTFSISTNLVLDYEPGHDFLLSGSQTVVGMSLKIVPRSSSFQKMCLGAVSIPKADDAKQIDNFR